MAGLGAVLIPQNGARQAQVALLARLIAKVHASSRSQARRLVEQKAVRIDGEVVADSAMRLPVGSYLLKVGKRRFAKVRLS